VTILLLVNSTNAKAIMHILQFLDPLHANSLFDAYTHALVSFSMLQTLPQDFSSASKFVTETSFMMAVIGILITAAMLFNGKIFFGSLFSFVSKAFHVSKYGETYSEQLGRAGLGWKILISFFMGFVLISISIPYLTWIVYGAPFFLVLWLLQLNSRSRPDKSITNRALGLIGLLIATFFTWEVLMLIANYSWSMVQNIAVLFGSGTWSILISTLVLIGFIGIVSTLALLYIRAFGLLRHGFHDSSYAASGQEALTRHSAQPRCDVCNHSLNQGFVCSNCGYGVCWECTYVRDISPSIDGRCPKCGGVMYPYPEPSLDPIFTRRQFMVDNPEDGGDKTL